MGALGKRLCGLDGNHFVVLIGKPGGIAARTGADVEHEKLGARQKGEPVAVEFSRIEALVLSELTSPPAIPAVAWRGILPFIDRNRRPQTRRVYPGLQVLEFGSARPYSGSSLR